MLTCQNLKEKAIAGFRGIADGLLWPRKRHRRVDYDGNDSCEKLASQADTSFNFLGLPDSVLENVVSFLDPEEELTLFQTSRACLEVVLRYHAGFGPLPRCTVSKSTTWRGLRQVLSWIPTPIALAFQPFDSPKPMHRDGISAYKVFLGSASTPVSLQQAICDRCRFPCVIDVDVLGCKIRSLVPRVIAATCPNLKYCRTSVRGTHRSYPDRMDELHPCHQLAHLIIHDDKAMLPYTYSHAPLPRFHTAAELIAAFPNLTGLWFSSSVVLYVMHTFSQQVSMLSYRLRNQADATLLQAYSQLSFLSLGGDFLVNNLLPLPAVTEHLSSLEVTEANITDTVFEQLLQLPQLRSLTVQDFNSLQLDYSSRKFEHTVRLSLVGCIQELRVFAKVPTSSLDQCVLCHPNLEVHLPDASAETDSLNTLSRMAKNFADAGLRIHPKHSIKWVTPKTVNGADAALLYYVASQAVCPTAECDLTGIGNRPALLAAVLKWAAPNAIHILVQLTPETSQPHIWQLFQQLQYVSSVTLSVEPEFQQTNRRGKLVAQVCDVVCSAAKHFVKPAFNPGERITFATGIGTPGDEEACSKHVGKISEIMKESLPDTVQIDRVEIYDTGWELTLKKSNAKAAEADA